MEVNVLLTFDSEKGSSADEALIKSYLYLTFSKK